MTAVKPMLDFGLQHLLGHSMALLEAGEHALNDDVGSHRTEEVDHLAGDGPARLDGLVHGPREDQNVAGDGLWRRREAETGERVSEDVWAPVRLGELHPTALRERGRRLGGDVQVDRQEDAVRL